MIIELERSQLEQWTRTTLDLGMRLSSNDVN